MIKGLYFETESRFNGEKIVVIFTGLTKNSSNSKTGHMIQSWILSARSNPYATSKARKDFAICGDCPQRHSLGGKCYVNLMHGPYAVFKAYKKGNYTKLNLNLEEHKALLRGKNVRIGSYGDPCAVDLEFWKDLLAIGFDYTGYTHQWNKPENKGYQAFCMASTENEIETLVAQERGWRTFRVRGNKEALLKTEYMCPASVEGGKKLTCETCLSCNGNGLNKTTPKSVAIILHGTWTKKSERFIEV